MANNEAKKLPPNFRSLIADFTNDLSITYPDYSGMWVKWNDPDASDDQLMYLFEYCLKTYPERFFDILYQNNDIFNADSEINTYFLPNVSFRLLFNCEDVTETTKKTMWKYLQLVLFSITGGIKDKSTFGDTMNMFEGIDEDMLQEKLKETMGGITDFFSKMENMESKGTEAETKEPFENTDNPTEGMPKMENIHEHLKTLFEGKIGSLAKEMAEEISGDFSDLIGEDMQDARSTQDIIQKLMKNPKKIMDLMKKVSGKLDSKMKSGEISRDELMKEAGDLLGKMKGMGGQDEFSEMFKKMASSMGGLGKNMKLDTNAMERMTKQASMRDKMKAKMEQKKQMQSDDIEKKRKEIRERVEAQQKVAAAYSLNPTELPNNFVFKLDGEDSQEKSSLANSFIHPDLLKEIEVEKKPVDKKKKKKTKK